MLEAQNVYKVYNHSSKAVYVLKGVDLNIEKGRFAAIVGPSGAGKSTLLHILGGIDTPTQGKILLDEQDIYSLSDLALCRVRNERIGFVFQFYHLLSEFTVLENVLMPGLIKAETPARGGSAFGGKNPACSAGRQQPTIQEESRGLLSQVGLGDRMRHFPTQLSGGEQQRVAIVRALINKPDLLLCDEPTGNLDSKTGEGIISLIKKINIERQMTVVLVTHNLELAKVADQVYYLKDGVLVN
ncbi:MAG: ABC transporter ATP-binding protein [Candidatus Omnitrophica bacterium]|nr:ABC transporter ATP-binding protein [Candidatus Omnitrophota bacterium]MBU4346392.1 ABC transporter ATP-binding protein [Candidatus Omnitrophota bacterium]MBU4473089.1 ABC transporter ATP-binding protein [Candidatus Omnitrophota bacterium]MCG2706848.1 ABC transporter ATP-binding protein [Candidatus Omnitrophota bacterium]